MRRVLFLCDRPLGTLCLQFLLTVDCQVCGVVSRDEGDIQWWGRSRVRSLCEAKGIAWYEFSRPLTQIVGECRPDLLLSVLYPKIVDRGLLARISSFNLHCAPLPGYRGFNSTLWAILNGEEAFGVTLHEMSEEPDEGRLIARGFFLIPWDVTNIELYKRSHGEGYRIFRENVHALISGTYQPTPQVGPGRYYRRKDLPSREVCPQWEEGRIATVARAFHFPPFEPAYLMARGQKVWLIPETRYYPEGRLRGDGVILEEGKEWPL
jgi:methionyl-tRNA formyltransferase